ncbi:MAG: 3-methyl-2-oxobutanoate hydroxymethyltransferase [Chloroflexi bacterium]|nr:3-methyl-2-oxobutanoate hydroxymethyltransferase [Chloroflexota bacterium]
MRITVDQIKQMKKSGEKIAMLTAYDYPTAKLADAAGVQMILVGDSLGMVVLGYESTLPVTMDEMLHHVKAVVRGSSKAMVVGDMPFMSYQASLSEAMHNAGRFLKEANCQAVKLEGGERTAETIRHIVQAGIPVVGHIGLTPQSVNQLSGYKLQGKTPKAAVQLIKDAHALEEAGAFAIVLESIPAPLAKVITERIGIPTIGIGAGVECDGQVQVFHDIMGLYPDLSPKHAKRYASLAGVMQSAIAAYVDEVKRGTFPTAKESYGLDNTAVRELTEIAAR